nr:immunoglobulin heavy chain junction region [Mus musculus]MBK4187133.1 immunoglobulin heavy chain junction region [Mus musculus]
CARHYVYYAMDYW